MASVNKIILVGNLGADPESRNLPSGEAVCNLRLATTEKWKDKATGDAKEVTEWHRVVLFRKLAEIASQYLKKGAAVYIEGRIRTRKWQDKDGQERYTTEIEASEMKMLGGRQETSEPNSFYANMELPTSSFNQRDASNTGNKTKFLDDDTIPF